MSIHEKAAVGFDRVGDSYERGRPEYPQEAMDFLAQSLGIIPSSVVVDLGAGTGKFTKLLVPLGDKIVAVEPVAGMRKKFQSLFPNLQIIEGTAEKIPLEDHSVDAIVSAQAFHWFDGPAAIKEIYRVLKPKGKLGLIWNARDESVDWVSQLTNIIDPYEGGAPRYKKMKWKEAFNNTTLFSALQLRHFSYVQVGTIETIVDRIGSISFISALPDDQKKDILNRVSHLVETHLMTQNQSQIKLPYRTDVYWCEKL